MEGLDILLFYYYKGYIAIILNQLKLAFNSFKTALTIPTEIVHK